MFIAPPPHPQQWAEGPAPWPGVWPGDSDQLVTESISWAWTRCSSSSRSLSCRVFRSRAAEKDAEQTEHYEKRHAPNKLRDAATQKLRESEKKFSPGCSSVWRHTPENQKQPAVMDTCAADVVV